MKIKYTILPLIFMLLTIQVFAQPDNKYKKRSASLRQAHYKSNHKKDKTIYTKIMIADRSVFEKADREWLYRRNIARSNTIHNVYKGPSGYDD